MGRKFTVTTSGFCPETGKQQTITVALESIQLGGGIPSGNKVMSYALSLIHISEPTRRS